MINEDPTISSKIDEGAYLESDIDRVGFNKAGGFVVVADLSGTKPQCLRLQNVSTVSIHCKHGVVHLHATIYTPKEKYLCEDMILVALMSNRFFSR